MMFSLFSRCTHQKRRVGNANHGIILLLRGKLQCGALLQFDTDIAGQHDRSLNIIGTRGNHNFCSLHGRSLPDGLGKGSPAVSLSIVLSSQPADKQSLFCYSCTGSVSKDTVPKSYPLLLYGRRQMTGIFVLGMRMLTAVHQPCVRCEATECKTYCCQEICFSFHWLSALINCYYLNI